VFAVIYQAHIKAGKEAEYRAAWRIIARYYVQERGAIGSCLHKSELGLWVAYSRWPDQATRDASWPQEGEPLDLPQEIREAVLCLKDCLAEQLPEIRLTVVDALMGADLAGGAAASENA
jgi:hypothetical protein